MQRCQNKGDVKYASVRPHDLFTLHTDWSVLVLTWSVSQVWSLQPELLPCLKYAYEHKNTQVLAKIQMSIKY